MHTHTHSLSLSLTHTHTHNRTCTRAQTSKLDYVVEPQRDERLAAAAAAAGNPSGSKRDEGRFAKKMREVQRKQKHSTARAAVPSVEGRTIVL